METDRYDDLILTTVTEVSRFAYRSSAIEQILALTARSEPVCAASTSRRVYER
jgi:hypothetical protein